MSEHRDDIAAKYHRLLSRLSKDFQGVRIDLAASLHRVQKELDTDPVTGLGSKFRFDKLKLNEGDVLVFGDISRFKHYNDRYNHEMGDRIIVEFGRIIRHVVGQVPTAQAFRLSGDEFAMAFEQKYWVAARRHAKLLTSAKLDWSELEKKDQSVTMALGYAECTVDGESPSSALARAEDACQFGKATGNHLQGWDDEVRLARWVSARDTCKVCSFKITLFGSAASFKKWRKEDAPEDASMSALRLRCPVCQSVIGDEKKDR